VATGGTGGDSDQVAARHGHSENQERGGGPSGNFPSQDPGTATNIHPFPDGWTRLGGTFYWTQPCNAISAGCTMVCGAMFHEMDEGTAIS